MGEAPSALQSRCRGMALDEYARTYTGKNWSEDAVAHLSVHGFRAEWGVFERWDDGVPEATFHAFLMYHQDTDDPEQPVGMFAETADPGSYWLWVPDREWRAK